MKLKAVRDACSDCLFVIIADLKWSEPFFGAVGGKRY